jgi:hypothetical protein
MKQFRIIAVTVVVSSVLSAIAAFFIGSLLMEKVWREEASFRLGFIEIEGTRDSGIAEMQILNALAIVESARKGDTGELLSLACTGLTFSLPNVRPSLYADAPQRQAEIEGIVTEGRALLEELRREGICLTRP